MVQIHIRGVSIEFPFTPYDCQVSYMEKVIQCLQEVRCIFRVYLGVRTCDFFFLFCIFCFPSFYCVDFFVSFALPHIVSFTGSYAEDELIFQLRLLSTPRQRERF